MTLIVSVRQGFDSIHAIVEYSGNTPSELTTHSNTPNMIHLRNGHVTLHIVPSVQVTIHAVSIMRNTLLHQCQTILLCASQKTLQ